MSSDAPVPGIELHPESFPLNGNGNHTQLIAQLAEEVGYLRGVLDAMDATRTVEAMTSILVTAVVRANELAAIRRSSSVTGGAR